MSILSPKLYVDKWADELNSEFNKLSNLSPFVPSDKDLVLGFQNLYKNKQFLDFEIKTADNNDPIRVHRTFLIVNGFKHLTEFRGQTFEIDANKELVQSLIDGYYYQNFDLKMNANNIEEYLEIANLFGVEDFFDYLTEKKKELDFIEFYEKFNEFKNTSVKRKTNFRESLSNKTMKTSDNMTTDELNANPVINNWMNSSIDSNISGDQTIIESKGNQSIDESLDAKNTDKSVSDENEDSNNATIFDGTTDSETTQTINRLTTEIIGFIPQSDESDSNLTADQSVSELTKTDSEYKSISSDNQNANKISECLPSIAANKLNQSSIRSHTGMNYTKLIKSVTGQTDRAALVRAQNHINKTRRSRSMPIEDNLTNETAENTTKYRVTKYLTQDPKQKSTQVWKSRFVPKGLGDEQLVAVVGGPFVNWFNLDQIKHNEAKCAPSLVFKSPNGKNLRSIAVSVIHKPIEAIIYAIGSVGCVYVFKHPDSNEVDSSQVIEGFVGKDEEVTDIWLQITPETNLLFCGTSDKKIVIYDIKFDATGRLQTTSCEQKMIYSTTFPIASILYIDIYDCLVASGESPDLIVIKDISTVDQKLIVGKMTPKMNTLSISSLVYIRELDLIGFRSVNTDYIQLAQMDRILAKFDASKTRSNKPITLPFWPGAKLQYKRSQMGSELIEFIDMCCNGGLIACGDAYGNVYVYTCNQLLKGKSMIQPTQVMGQKWPNSPPIIRSVSISDDLRYMVNTTNDNLILVCQPIPIVDSH